MQFRYASTLFCSLLLGCDLAVDSLDVQYYEGEDPSNRDLMNTLKSIQKQLKRSVDS
jgi:hypothetical protein